MNSTKKKKITPAEARINTRLSLRKKEMNKKLLGRLLQSSEEVKKEEYEYTDGDFLSLGMTQDKLTDCTLIFDISYDDLLVSANTQNKVELKLWIHKVLMISKNGSEQAREEKILKKMTKEKMMLLFSLLVDQIKNIGILSIDELKLKYEIACILINMVYDTNTYNDLFIEKSDVIYDCIILMLKENKDKLKILIYHYEWLLANIIESKEMYEIIEKTKHLNIPYLIQTVFDYNFSFEDKDNSNNKVNLWLLKFYLYNVDKSLYEQYIGFFKYIMAIIDVCINKSNMQLLMQCFELLVVFASSEKCLKEIMNTKSSVIHNIIMNYTLSVETQELVNQLLINDESKTILKTYDIFNLIILPFLNNMKETNREKIINNIELCKIVIKQSPNSIEIMNRILDISQFRNILTLYTTTSQWKVKKSILELLKELFNRGDPNIKESLINICIHKFFVQELKKCIDEECDTQIIVVILDAIGDILLYADKTYNKINYTQKELEEEDLYGLLDKLQFYKKREIYERAVQLLEQYFPYE